MKQFSNCRATREGPLKRVLVSQRSQSFYNFESISNDLMSNGDEKYLPFRTQDIINVDKCLTYSFSWAKQC